MNKLMQFSSTILDELNEKDMALVKGGIVNNDQLQQATNNGNGTCSGTNNADGTCGGTNNSNGKCGVTMQ